MLTTNNNCTKITYCGEGVLTSSDLSDISNYSVSLEYQGTKFKKELPITIVNNGDDFYTTPCGLVKDTNCEGDITCSSTAITEPIYGDTYTNFSAPQIDGFGWLPNVKEEEIVINLSTQSAFRSLSIGSSIILSTTDNQKYSPVNTVSGISASDCARLLQKDLENGFLESPFKAIVEVEYLNYSRSFRLRIKFLSIVFPLTSYTVTTTEYSHISNTASNIVFVYTPSGSVAYNKDRVYLRVVNYNRSNTAYSYWEFEDEGDTIQTIKSNDKYVVFYKDMNFTSVFNVYYVIRTIQGEFVKYKFRVGHSISSQGSISVDVTPLGSFSLDNTTPKTQVFTNYGAGAVIDNKIIRCESVSTGSEDVCTTCWEFTTGYFADDCDLETQFADGVYTLTITVKYSDGTCDVFQECVFVGCNIECRLVEFLAKNKDRVDLVAILMALKNFTPCNLSCEELEELYDYLNNQLGNGTTNSTDCGCV